MTHNLQTALLNLTQAQADLTRALQTAFEEVEAASEAVGDSEAGFALRGIAERLDDDDFTVRPLWLAIEIVQRQLDAFAEATRRSMEAAND